VKLPDVDHRSLRARGGDYQICLVDGALDGLARLDRQVELLGRLEAELFSMSGAGAENPRALNGTHCTDPPEARQRDGAAPDHRGRPYVGARQMFHRDRDGGADSYS
jgi:hypothetical protein